MLHACTYSCTNTYTCTYMFIVPQVYKEHVYSLLHACTYSCTNTYTYTCTYMFLVPQVYKEHVYSPEEKVYLAADEEESLIVTM